MDDKYRLTKPIVAVLITLAVMFSALACMTQENVYAAGGDGGNDALNSNIISSDLTADEWLKKTASPLTIGRKNLKKVEMASIVKVINDTRNIRVYGISQNENGTRPKDGKDGELLTMWFEDCGKVNDVQTKVRLQVTKVTFGDRYCTGSQYADKKDHVSMLYLYGDKEVWVGSDYDRTKGLIYPGSMKVKVKMTVYSMKDGSVIKYPFGCSLADIDQIKGPNGSKYEGHGNRTLKETVTVGNAFTDYFKWKTCEVGLDGRTFYPLEWSNTSETSSKRFTVAGVFVATDSDSNNMILTIQGGGDICNQIRPYKVYNRGEITIKKAAKTGSVITGKYNFNDISFTIYEVNGKSHDPVDPVKVLTKNKDSITVELPEGTYTIKETKGNDWYEKAPETTYSDNHSIWKVNVKRAWQADEHVYVFRDPPKTGKIKITKTITGDENYRPTEEQLSQLVFKLTSNTTVNKNGNYRSYRVNLGHSYDIQTGDTKALSNKMTAEITGVPYDDYVLTEETASIQGFTGGYFDEEKAAARVSISINKNNTTKNIKFENEWIGDSINRLKVIKEITEGTGNESREGFVFKLYDNQVCTGNPVGECTTDINGVGYINGLEEDQTYWLKEDPVKSGYEPVTANPSMIVMNNLSGPEIIDGSTIYTKEYTFRNKRLYPSIRVEKITKKGGVRTNNVTGITFALYKGNDRIAQKSTIRDPDDDTLGVVTFTNSDLTHGKIENGTYTIKEVNLDPDYKSNWPLAGGVPTTTVEVNGYGTSGVVDAPTCENTYNKSEFTVKVVKTPSENIDIRLTKYSFEGITYSIYTDEECQHKLAADSTIRLTLDSNDRFKGTGSYSWSTTGGETEQTVYVKEDPVPANCGFTRDTNVYTVNAVANEVTKVNGDAGVKETPDKGSLTFGKLITLSSSYSGPESDAPDPRQLKFTLKSKETGDEYTGRINWTEGSWESEVSFTNIPLGEYTLTESGLENYNTMVSTTANPQTVIIGKTPDNAPLQGNSDTWNNTWDPVPGETTLVIKKSSSQKVASSLYSMEGIRYNVYPENDPGCTGTPIDSIVLHGDSEMAIGTAAFTLAPGVPNITVYVQEDESSVPSVYDWNDTIMTAVIPEGGTKTLTAADGAENDPHVASLVFTKEIFCETDGYRPPGPEKLRFTLRNTDDPAMAPITASVGSSNTVRFDNIPVGHYTLTETGCEQYTKGADDKAGRMEDVTGPLELTLHTGANGLESAGINNSVYRNKWIPKIPTAKFIISVNKKTTENWNVGAYTLKGITYSVYTDSSTSSSSKVADIELSPTGGANKEAYGKTEFIIRVEKEGDDPVTKKFYVKENTPPAGSNVEKDMTVYEVNALEDTEAKVNGNSGLSDTNKYGTLEFDKIIENLDERFTAPTPENLTFTLTSIEDPSITFTAHPQSVRNSVKPDKSAYKVRFEDGNGDLRHLPLGRYTLKETGLELYRTNLAEMKDVTGSREVVISEGANTINSSNEYTNMYDPDPKGGLDIYKQCEDPSADLRSFHVTVTNVDTNEVIINDEAFSRSGIIKKSGLMPGEYKIHEELDHPIAEGSTYKWSDLYEQPDDQYVTVTENDTAHKKIYIENVYKKIPLDITKQDENGNIEGIEFMMEGTSLDGKTIYYGPVETDATGHATLNGVVAGSFIVEETGFPEIGYTTTHIIEGHDFPAQQVTSDGVTRKNLTFVNIPLSLQIDKEEDACYEDGSTPVSAQGPVDGAVYTLYRYDDAVTSETTEENISDSPSIRLVTDENGHAETSELTAGTYWLYETEAPAVYKEDRTIPAGCPITNFEGNEPEEGDPQESSIGRFIGVYDITASNNHISVSDTNARKFGSIVLNKIDDKGLPVEGAEFTLFKQVPDDLGHPQLVVVKNKDGKEMKAVTDEFGSITKVVNGESVSAFSGLEWGTYYLEETKVPTGYRKADMIECVIGPETGIDIEAVTENQGGIIDPRQPGKVELFKYDETTGDPLDGITFDLYTKEGELIAHDLVTGTDHPGALADEDDDGIMDGAGRILYEGLAWGEYYFVETASDSSHTLDTEPVRFSINRNTSTFTLPLSKSNRKAPAEITASVKFKADTYWPDHGDPTFFVILEDLTTGKQQKRPLTFDSEYISQTVDSEGYVKKSVTFPVEADNPYTLVSVRADRYVLDTEYDSETHALTDLANVTERLENDTKTKLSVPASSTGTTTFVYTKNDWSEYGDATAAKNIIKKSRTFVGVTASWNGDPSRVDANLLYDPGSQLTVYAVFDDGSVRELRPSEYSVTDQLGEGIPEITTDIDGNTIPPELREKRWPKTAGSYTYNVTASIAGTSRTGQFSITVLPPVKVKVYFHNGVTDPIEQPTIHIEHPDGNEVIDGETVDYIEIWKNQKMGQIPAADYSISWGTNNFSMWSKTPDVGEEMSAGDEISEDTHYYAVWNAAIFKVIYNKNTPNAAQGRTITVSGMPSNMSARSGGSITISDKMPSVNEGYEFAGWKRTANGSGDFVTPGSEYTGGSSGIENLQLYAQWTPHSAVLKYKTNEDEGNTSDPVGGFAEVNAMKSSTPDPSQLTIAYGAGQTAAPALVKLGYEFTGWNTKFDGSGASYQPGDLILPDGRDLTVSEQQSGITLYAQWKHQHLGDNGGSGDNGDLSWDDIQTIGDAGIAQQFFAEDFLAVKDDLGTDGLLTAKTLAEHTKEVSINNTDAHAMIAGFDHDKITGSSDTAAMTFITYETVGEGAMERTGHAAAGWGDSSARTITLSGMNIGGGLDTYLKSVDKDYVNSSGTQAASSDTLFLPSVEELYGKYKYEVRP